MSKRIYINKINPEDYPEYTQRTAPAVTRDALENRIQFTSLRGFPAEQIQNKSYNQDTAITQNNNMQRIIHMEETVDMYVNHFKLGKVLWPVYPTLFAENFEELVKLCKRDGLYMFDFWGYVPGSTPSNGSIWGEYVIPSNADKIMREKLGNRFLGYDNGEQDGRYMSYSGTYAPVADCRRAQYKNFQKYFEKLFDDMLNHTVTLASLTFLHYFAKEGNSIMLGAETAQGLPSSPMWFSFIRGAGKQYGLLWYGNASVWNRWGFKEYSVKGKEADKSNGYEMGRFAGTSLGLLKRLMYNHYMYNCNILGFENCWFTTGNETDTENCYVIGGRKNKLTPIGEIQRDCVKFTERYPDPGTMYTPLAIVADFFAGWVPPRHLYTDGIYKVWGNLPYNIGDYQLHTLLTMLYPGYEDAGYFRDERGFDPPTPFGEIADVFLSDIRGAILNRYALTVILSSVELTLELYLKLKDYVCGGGKLIVFAETVNKYIGLTKYDPDYLNFFKSKTIIIDGYGLNFDDQTYSKENVINKPIVQPYSFIPEVKKVFENSFNDLRIISVNNKNLRYCVNIIKPGEYTLYVANSHFNDEQFDIICHEGILINVERLDISDLANKYEEYLPLMREDGIGSGTSGVYSIQAGDCQIWRVTTSEAQLNISPESLPVAQDKSLFLKIDNRQSVKDYLLQHPTFAHHFKGIMVSAEYLDKLDITAAKREAHYVKLQKVKIMADFTSMINHYPDLSLIGNIPGRTEEAMDRIAAILDKAKLYEAEAAVFTLQRNAENEWTGEQCRQGLEKSIAQIQKLCDERGIIMYVQNRPYTSQNSWGIKDNVKNFAVNTAFAKVEGYDYKNDLPFASLLMLSSALVDKFGQCYSVNNPVYSSADKDELKSCYGIVSENNIPIVLSAAYEDWDEVISDLEFLK
ncbi:MAG: hypothetical protein FWF15_06825 [Oscillospiraceae bacterium]|nr:hypothetical protein [Oscillospiraceae bacterium]